MKKFINILRIIYDSIFEARVRAYEARMKRYGN
jgi:hypothetical protein